MTKQRSLKISQQSSALEDEVQKVLEIFKKNGTSVLLKKEFADDRVKKNLSKTILHLLDVIKNNSDSTKKDKAQPSTKEVATNTELVANKPKKTNDADKKNLAQSNGKTEERTKKLEDQKKNICFAFKFNKCPFKNKEDCPKRHPQKCQKFCDFGHIAFDEKGCDTKNCDLLHPKLCRNSTKEKECPHKRCKFQHLQGTKFVPEIEFKNAQVVRGNREYNILVNKFDKLIEMFVNFVQNHEEGRKIQKS